MTDPIVPILTASRPSATDFDLDALRAKYRQERERRLRADGIDQYIEMKGDYAHFLDDPYAAPGFARPALTDAVEALIIGGGFGGLLAAARLKAAGVEDIRIVECGSGFGGTWYWNRYPGAACDVESYIYLPLLEEAGYIPSERYARQPEILDYCRTLGQHFGLYEKACFQTQVTGLDWDETDRRWVVSTNRGDRMRARFICMVPGPMNRPKLPGIPGIESFKGRAFHTSRWDYDYTGGDPTGGLSRLADKRVGLIGTGATAIQCVPHLGASADRLYVFQRTPSSVDVRNNAPTDPDWVSSLEPGWQRRRMENFTALLSGVLEPEDLVGDSWTDMMRAIVFRASTQPEAQASPDAFAELMQRADFEKMEQIRGRVQALVTDPATAEALKPWYNQFCKRPCFHDEYLQTFNRPNVTLVDTGGKGVERITEDAVIVDGVRYEVDCLVYATGFEVGTSLARRTGYEIRGRGGETLSSAWSEGMRSLHGIQVHGFPNCFLMGTGQAGFSVNYPHMLDEQSRHIAYVVAEARGRGAAEVEVTEAAEAAWVEQFGGGGPSRRSAIEECTPGYYNLEGRPSGRGRRDVPYGKGPIAYVRLLERWREAGLLEGLGLSG